MATVLDSYDWSVVRAVNKRPRTHNYPWHEWFDGRIWQLEPKTDFEGPPASLERVIRTAANRKGIKVRIRIDGKSVVIQRHRNGAVLRDVTTSQGPAVERTRDKGTAKKAPAKATKTPAKTPAKASTKAPSRKTANKATPPRTERRMKRAQA